MDRFAHLANGNAHPLYWSRILITCKDSFREIQLQVLQYSWFWPTEIVNQLWILQTNLLLDSCPKSVLINLLHQSHVGGATVL